MSQGAEVVLSGNSSFELVRCGKFDVASIHARFPQQPFILLVDGYQFTQAFFRGCVWEMPNALILAFDDMGEKNSKVGPMDWLTTPFQAMQWSFQREYRRPVYGVPDFTLSLPSFER